MPTRRDLLIGAAAAGLPGVITSGVAGPSPAPTATSLREDGWDQGRVGHLLPAVSHEPSYQGVVRSSLGVTARARRRDEPRARTTKPRQTRLYNVASFEWSRVVQRGLLSSKSGRSSRGFRARASQFDAHTAVFPDGLMWHRRSDSRPTVDGGAHGPAHGSPSADCARIVRDDEVQCPASDRRLHLFSANGAADTGCADAQQGQAAASPGDDGKAAER